MGTETPYLIPFHRTQIDLALKNNPLMGTETEEGIIHITVYNWLYVKKIIP